MAESEPANSNARALFFLSKSKLPESPGLLEEAKFGGNNILSVEDVEGYITPESKRVKINGKNKYVKESFQYEKDVEIPEDAKIISIENPDSIKVDLSNKVKATFDNNMKKDVTVIWNVKKEAELIGIVEGTDIQPKLSILVDEKIFYCLKK